MTRSAEDPAPAEAHPEAGFLGRRGAARTLAAGLVLVLGALAFFGSRYVDRTLRRQFREQVEAVLGSTVAGVEILLERKSHLADTAREEPRVQAAFDALVVASREGATAEALRASEHQRTLDEALAPLARWSAYVGFLAFDAKGRVLAASEASWIGSVPLAPSLRDELLDARASIVIPAVRVQDLPPRMLVGGRVASKGGERRGALVLVFDVRKELSKILLGGRIGASGETFAFDAEGRMVSESRFVDQLKSYGLLEQAATSAVLAVELRDPGGDVTQGFTPTGPLATRPLTRMARSAIEGGSGIDVEGYRDYRGVTVVGGWAWLPEYDLGVATEVDRREAYALGQRLRGAYWVLFGIVAAAMLGVVLLTSTASRWRRRTAMAERRVEQLGQYRLTRKLGEGGMGAVYEAEHALLRRPAAIKIMTETSDDPEAAIRFEREVQLTAQLTHLNTVEVYDYGRTPDGTFYYVMERLHGADMQSTVERHGPMPPGRVIHLMVQAAGALREAHEAGLVHRDIKPSNLFLACRGGVWDVLKVLDFGLVKQLDAGLDDAIATRVGTLVGTPMYMAPESVESSSLTDARSDVYALGLTAYFALTGHDAFEAETSTRAVCLAQMTQPPPSMASWGVDVPSDLEAAILAAIAKEPEERPSAAAWTEALRACADAGRWSEADADAWWQQRATVDEGEGEPLSKAVVPVQPRREAPEGG